MKAKSTIYEACRRLPVVLVFSLGACAAEVDGPATLGSSELDLRGGARPDGGPANRNGNGGGGGGNDGSDSEGDDTTTRDRGLTGNGAPSGSHYTLNLIGMPKDKSADLTGNNGRRIFVPLNGSSKIMLTEGAFQVLDANGTDGEAAFQLPSPDPDNDGVTEYSVYVRALGTPGGSSKTTTCATEPTTGDLYCSVESTVLLRDRGRSKFDNVSRELLYVHADIDGDGDVDRVPLFGDELTDYFWEYDNNGLRIAQLRFYPVSTDVN